MAAPYLTEIRLSEPRKTDIQNIIYDVADRFGVRGAVRDRPVPHITLFGPYNTNNGYEAKDRVQSVLDQYDVVPYRINDFGHFDRHTIYVNVEPSDELRSLRRDVRDALLPITYNYRDYDTDEEYDFHITIAFKDIENQFDEIWEYVNKEYQFDRDVHALRVTALRHREMMWEWDLPRGVELRPNQAKRRKNWKRSENALEYHLYKSEADDESKFQKLLRRIRNLTT
jgi:2'-5' RNA ligase